MLRTPAPLKGALGVTEVMELTVKMALEVQIDSLIWLFRDRTRLLDRHIADIDRDLNRRAKDLTDSLNAELESCPDHERDEIRSVYSEHISEVAEDIPNLHRRSYLITTMSLLENLMHSIATRVGVYKREQNPQLEVPNIGIDKSMRFLRDVLGIAIPNNNLWTEIRMAQDFRNCIAHANGNTKGSRRAAEIAKHLSQISLIQANRQGDLLFGEEYLPALLETTLEFAEQLVLSVTQTVRSAT